MPAIDPRAGLALREVLPQARQFRGEIRVTSLATDLEQIRPGDLFVAIDHGNIDGHDLAEEALARGASAVLAERLLPLQVPIAVVQDTRAALGELCQALVGQPTHALRTIGVTGSLGKTVTSVLIASILEAAERPCGVIAGVGLSDSVDQIVGRRDTPPAPETAHWMSRSVENGCEDCVIECSSAGLAERRLAGVCFDAAVITNVRREHVARHGSLANYVRAKKRILEQLKPGGVAIFNADDAGSRALLETFDGAALTFGRNVEANITAEIIERHASEQSFLLHAGDETVVVCTKIIGDHHVSNCLAAAAAALGLGIDLKTIVRGLEAVTFVPGRMERLECGQSFRVFVDGARTPDSLAIALHSAKKVAKGRVICVFGCEGGKEQERRPWMGRVAERSADLTVITSDDARYEEPLRIAHDILDGFESPGKAHVIPDRRRAIEWALSQARPGDVVVIAGKGDRAVDRVGKNKLPWSDREVACEILYAQDEPVILPFRRPRVVTSQSAN